MAQRTAQQQYHGTAYRTTMEKRRGRIAEMSHIIPKMFATDTCVKVPLFDAASPLHHSVAYVMAEGRFHHKRHNLLTIVMPLVRR